MKEKLMTTEVIPMTEANAKRFFDTLSIPAMSLNCNIFEVFEYHIDVLRGAEAFGTASYCVPSMIQYAEGVRNTMLLNLQ